MRSTQANFWSMVYDHDVRVVVVMDPVKHDIGTSNRKNEAKTFERFWPTSSYPTAPNGGKVFLLKDMQLWRIQISMFSSFKE